MQDQLLMMRAPRLTASRNRECTPGNGSRVGADNQVVYMPCLHHVRSDMNCQNGRVPLSSRSSILFACQKADCHPRIDEDHYLPLRTSLITHGSGREGINGKLVWEQS